MSGPVADRSLRSRSRQTFVLASIATVLAVVLGVVALRSLLDARRNLIDRVDPAALASERLLSAAVDQETGVRAYLLAGDDSFLLPYRDGLTAEFEARGALREAAARITGVAPRLADVDDSIRAWQVDYAEPVIAAVAADRPDDVPPVQLGRTRFDAFRAELRSLQATLDVERGDAKDALDAATYRLIGLLGVALLLVLVAVAALWRLVRRSVQVPLDALGTDARVVAGGELAHAISPVGPAELRELAEAMELMRRRIIDELAEVERQAADLRRSNAELEQFAYVASHDLQEPLRKVASFCQLLQSRYGGQLDERADQYIDFAVDGAKRMQSLINDLLAFSRVGRVETEMTVVDGDELLQRAIANVASAIEESGARITAAPLPPLLVEPNLVVALLQNLLANAIKFRRPDTHPHLEISVVDRDGEHEFAVHDDGIGIQPEYAERVFVIFQRLHTKEEYEGTGIGLAMCRKIVERHGGRIWIDEDVTEGTTVRFTLPVVVEPDDAPLGTAGEGRT